MSDNKKTDESKIQQEKSSTSTNTSTEPETNPVRAASFYNDQSKEQE